MSPDTVAALSSLNDRQAAFALAKARGLSSLQSIRAAGYVSSNAESARRLGRLMASTPKIARAIGLIAADLAATPSPEPKGDIDHVEQAHQ
jgi:hypothetical protein